MDLTKAEMLPNFYMQLALNYPRMAREYAHTRNHFVGLVHNCSISSALALKFRTEPLISSADMFYIFAKKSWFSRLL